jgi:DHA1 family bicyclomycin/chloramphenicol resistance-like MFS transporter
LTQPPPRAFFAVTLAAVSLMGPLAVHLFIPVLPAVHEALGIGGGLTQLAFSVTLFVMAFMTLAYGALSDRLGRRPVLLAGLALFLVGSAISALADSIALLVCGRIIQAIGAASGLALSRAMARDVFGADQLVRVLGYLTMAYAVGPMLAPLVGGALGDAFGWRGIFWFAFGASAIIAFASALILRETHPVEKRRSDHFRSTLSGFRHLFSDIRFNAFVLQSGFAAGTYFALASGTAFLMQEVLHMPAAEFGLWFCLLAIGYSLGNLIATRTARKVSIETALLVASVGCVASIGLMAGFILSGNITPITIFAPGMLLTLFQGISLPNAQAGAINVAPHLAGTAAGIGVFAHMFGGGTFSQIYGLLSDGTPIPLVVTTATTAILTLVAGIVAYAKRPLPRGGQDAQE